MKYKLTLSHSARKTSFSLTELYMPMCIFDIWDVAAFKEEDNPDKLDLYVVMYYSVLYMLPILVIVTWYTH